MMLDEICTNLQLNFFSFCKHAVVRVESVQRSVVLNL